MFGGEIMSEEKKNQKRRFGDRWDGRLIRELDKRVLLCLIGFTIYCLAVILEAAAVMASENNDCI